MKFYHYAPKNNTVLKDGLLSASKSPRGVMHYAQRAGSEDINCIIEWLDGTFEGRSESVCCLTEPIRWLGNDPMLCKNAQNNVLFSFDLRELIKDGLVKAIWCKNGSDKYGGNETIYKVTPEDIDFSPLPWGKCSREKGLLYAVIRHYMIVLKDGYIPPQYIRKESQCNLPLLGFFNYLWFLTSNFFHKRR